MRIGYLYDLQVFPPKGGNHRHVLELVEGFIGSGHSVSVVDDPTLPGVTNYQNTAVDLHDFVDKIDVLYVRIDARFIRRWQVLSDCMDLISLQSVIWEINSPANENLAFSWLGGKIATSNKKEGLVRTFRRWFHALRQSPGIWLEERYRRDAAKRVATAICVSEAVGRYAKNDLGINDVLVLPNGGPLITEPEILQRRERRGQKGFSVLYSGSAIYPWQGLNYLSQVIKLAVTAAPDITFVLAVNQKVPGLSASTNVVILEGLNQEDVRDVICAADVCVALIPEWPWSKFGFHGSPTKLFEYMAFMVPVVTSNHSQMRDIICDGEDGLLAENNPESILEKLLFVKGNPEQAKRIGRNAWSKIHAKFNWQHNVKETLLVFERSLTKTAG
jgi:glycosyltransferase involved in cell wall biosynthesis